MEATNLVSIFVKCPHCGNKFSPDEAIQHDVREQLEKEYTARMGKQTRVIEQRIRKEENERFHSQMARLEADRREKVQKLKKFEEEAIGMAEREQQLKDREDSVEHELKRKLLDREKLIREQADKVAMERATLAVRERESALARDREAMEIILSKRVLEETEKVRDKEQMKLAELQKKMDDQARLIDEMKRKHEQGSMQTQGEVQELAIENYLESTFPRDIVEEVSKGKRGADCVHIVMDHYDRSCGRILYESKRTKHFSYEWIAKIKEDIRQRQADIGVIVTEALPAGMTRFGELEGILICTFSEFKALSLLLRQNVARIGEVMSAQENRGEKMQLIYNYVTSLEFKQKLEAAFESYSDMQDDLMREKAMMTSQWAKREKRLFKAMENIVCLYGDVRGIAGGAVQEIRSLELSEMNLIDG
jgi:hypothetical protein